MKTKIKLLLLSSTMFLVFQTKSQVSVPSNFGSPADYVGWDIAQPFPVEIQHQGNQQINISTNGFRRIQIDNGAGSTNDGRVLIADDALGISPTARLHLHHKGNGFPNIRFSTGLTGATSSDGFEIGMSPSGEASFILSEFNSNFNWYNEGGGPGLLKNRMRLYGDGVGQNTGRLVLSDNLPTSFTPGARLHIFQATGGTQNGKLFRTDGDSTGTSEWELYTGTTINNLVRKFRIMTSVPSGYNNNGGDVYQEAFQGDIIFRVNGKRTGGTGSGTMPPNAGYATNGAKEVMRITHVYNNYLQRNEGRVSISMDTTATVGTTIRNPRSMLHIGEVSSGGWRNWMNVGTYYDYGTDCMYTGIKALSPLSLDQNEAIIAWGNNPTAANQPDRLRFVFTAAGIGANGTAGSLDGLEAIRIVADTGTTKMGIGNFYFINTNPANMLEIKSDAKCPYWLTNNSSGLRLRNLTSAAPIVANGTNGVNNQKMLTVDVNGDVVLTTVPTVGPSASPGNYCSTTSNPLTSDYQVPLNTKKYLFSGQSIINNSVQQDVVAVGYNCAVSLPLSKFSVLENQPSQTTTETYAGYFENNNSTSSQNFQDINGGLMSRSFRSQSTVRTTNVGGIFEAHNCMRSIGIIGRLGRSSIYGPTNIGVGGMFIADTIPLTGGGTNYDNYGVYAKATSGVNNFAIYAETVGPSNLNPITPMGNFAGYFVGDVVRTGNDNFTSDKKLKENIENLPDGLSILNKIETKIYDYKTSEYEHMNLPRGKQYGVIAQQVQTLLPELINQVVHPAKFDAQGNMLKEKVDYLTVEYQQFIPLLIRSVQQLSEQNNHLDSVVKALTKTLNINETSTGLNQNTINTHVELTDKNSVVLNQNVPNPFAESTIINYEVSVDFSVAQIIFNTNNGRIIKVVDIKEKGKGTLNVFANDLSSGVYNYYLIIDGKIIDTKKMIKQD